MDARERPFRDLLIAASLKHLIVTRHPALIEYPLPRSIDRGLIEAWSVGNFRPD